MTVPAPPIEIWGGVECTVNRVGDRWLDQFDWNGHGRRDGDLERFAALGLRALRFPVLWERVAPLGVENARWEWADDGLARLRALAIRPVVGLVHHGSGPHGTDLLDALFPEKLARFARAVAERYPWVEDFTPINEPLTTARFSALYGHWYPHERSTVAFVRALFVQLRATVLAMREIRLVNPAARLVTTEDVGRTFSTPLLAYQADHENARRWLGMDLLCGKVDETHPLYEYLLEHGVTPAEIDFFRAADVLPDVIGLNYYITSDRWLDERVDRYPAWSHGGNGKHAYADVEAVRARESGIWGHEAVLAEAWARYGLPLAFTEVHIGSSREDQLRWLLEAWDAAGAMRARGADVRAVTSWALLGSFDWNKLVVRYDGTYEPGAFDLRSPEPRETAIASLLRSLASGRRPDHPLLGDPGWWLRDERWFPGCAPHVPAWRGVERARPVVITGATGTLGSAFARECVRRGITFRILSRAEMDIADPASVAAALDAMRPWAVINGAGYVRVDDAESDRVRCFRENALGPAVLGDACSARGIRMITFSSDLVFDGILTRGYRENDPVAPLNVYGESKAEGERLVAEAHPDALVIRTSAFFGPWDVSNFLAVAVGALSEGRTFHAASDAEISPTYVPDLVGACLELLIDGASGVWHLANAGRTTWSDFALRGARALGIPTEGVIPVATAELGLPASRPLMSVLESERAWIMPALDDALDRWRLDRVETRPAKHCAGGGGRSLCVAEGAR